MSSLSEIQKVQRVPLNGDKYSEREIQIQIGYSRHAVYNAAAMYQNGGSYSEGKKNGRPRKKLSMIVLWNPWFHGL